MDRRKILKLILKILAYGIIVNFYSCNNKNSININTIIKAAKIDHSGEFKNNIKSFNYQDTIELGEISIKESEILADGSKRFFGKSNFDIDFNNLELLQVTEADFITSETWVYTKSNKKGILFEYDFRNVKSQKYLNKYLEHHTRAYIGFMKNNELYIYICDFVFKVRFKLT